MGWGKRERPLKSFEDWERLKRDRQRADMAYTTGEYVRGCIKFTIWLAILMAIAKWEGRW